MLRHVLDDDDARRGRPASAVSTASMASVPPVEAPMAMIL